MTEQRTLRDLIQATRLTYRQIDYWIRQGYFHAAVVREQHAWRTMTEDEFNIGLTMARLVQAGFTARAAAELARRDVEEPTPDGVYVLELGIDIRFVH